MTAKFQLFTFVVRNWHRGIFWRIVMWRISRDHWEQEHLCNFNPFFAFPHHSIWLAARFPLQDAHDCSFLIQSFPWLCVTLSICLFSQWAVPCETFLQGRVLNKRDKHKWFQNIRRAGFRNIRFFIGKFYSKTLELLYEILFWNTRFLWENMWNHFAPRSEPSY